MANVFGPLFYFFTKFGRALPESLRDEERRSTTISPARPPECSDATALARSAVPSSDEEISRQIIRGTLQRNYFFQARDSDFERGIKKVVANNWITIDLRNRHRCQLARTAARIGAQGVCFRNHRADCKIDCQLLLLQGIGDNDPLFLQVKEAQTSVPFDPKRTSLVALHMSAFDPKRTWALMLCGGRSAHSQCVNSSLFY